MKPEKNQSTASPIQVKELFQNENKVMKQVAYIYMEVRKLSEQNN